MKSSFEFVVGKRGLSTLALEHWFLTFFYVFTLLTKVLTKFTLNILNNAHLLKNEISKLLQLYLFNVTAALVFWQRAFQCLVKL